MLIIARPVAIRGHSPDSRQPPLSATFAPCPPRPTGSRHMLAPGRGRSKVFGRAACGRRMADRTQGRGEGGLGSGLHVLQSDIGFVFDGKVVALRPVEVHSADYALQEYGLSDPEMIAAEKRIGAGIKSARARGEVTKFTGGKHDFH